MATETKMRMPVQVWVEMSDGTREPILAPGQRLLSVEIGRLLPGEMRDDMTIQLLIEKQQSNPPRGDQQERV